jgi:hypothetical protein
LLCCYVISARAWCECFTDRVYCSCQQASWENLVICDVLLHTFI